MYCCSTWLHKVRRNSEALVGTSFPQTQTHHVVQRRQYCPAPRHHSQVVMVCRTLQCLSGVILGDGTHTRSRHSGRPASYLPILQEVVEVSDLFRHSKPRLTTACFRPSECDGAQLPGTAVSTTLRLRQPLLNDRSPTTPIAPNDPLPSESGVLQMRPVLDAARHSTGLLLRATPPSGGPSPMQPCRHAAPSAVPPTWLASLIVCCVRSF